MSVILRKHAAGCDGSYCRPCDQFVPAMTGCGHLDCEPCAPGCQVWLMYREMSDDSAGMGDHLDDCVPFADMDGSASCTCGGMPCGASLVIGPVHDPYDIMCEYIWRGHPKEGSSLLHRGRTPLPGPGPEPQYTEWAGGGYCAGDPLPSRIVRHLGPDLKEIADVLA